MRELLKPYWIFLTVTLPQTILLLLYVSSFQVIHTQMKKEHIFNWKLYGALLVLLVCAATAYGIVRLIRRTTIELRYGIAVFLTYLPLLYVYIYNSDSIMPFGAPRWMFSPDDLLLYTFTFLMPAFGHALSVLVLRLTPEDKDHKLKNTIIGAALIPAAWYLWFNVVVPLFKGRLESRFYLHAFLVLGITSTIAFLFFVVRLAYLVLVKKPLATYRRAYIYKVFFLVFLPLLCFAVYNGFVSPGKGFREANFLGDVSHPWYYIMAAVSGILLSLPGFENRPLRLALFCAKSVTYSFVFYFFLALLPFMPLAIPAIIAFGLGFLMLTPLMVMVVHTQSLKNDYVFLKKQYSPSAMLAIFLAGFLVLPIGVTGSFLKDKIALNRMLNIVYSPDYTKEASTAINRSVARRTLENIKANKHSRALAWEERKPFITPYYQWLVLDNMTLSNQKIRTIERVFWGESGVNVQDDRDLVRRGVRPAITGIKTETASSQDGSYYKTWVHMTIQNSTTAQQEFKTSFRLPAGAWISDYYLKIGDEKVRGILTDKKSATWVYQQVVNERKDPGILYYTDSGEVVLRVFPFNAHEVRSTGFEIIHRGRGQMEIDRHRVTLAGGNGPGRDAVSALNENVVYLSGSAKAKLPRITRKPYYHFIIDCSVGTGDKREDYITRIRGLLARKLLDSGLVSITLANYQTSTLELKDGWEDRLRRFPAQGGFFLERAFKSALFAINQERPASRPVFIVVSDNITNAVFIEGMSGFKPLFPETDVYYELDAAGKLYSRALTALPSRRKAGEVSRIPIHHALAWPDAKNPTAFLADDSEDGIVLKTANFYLSPVALQGTTWANGLALQGMWMSMQLNPSGTRSGPLPLIKNSFKTRIMTPLTSFLVLENEAQRQAMLRKQERVLSANKALDIGEEREMSEPPLWALIIISIMIFVFNVIRSKRGKIVFFRGGR